MNIPESVPHKIVNARTHIVLYRQYQFLSAKR